MSIRRYNAYYYREVTKNGEWAIRKLSPHNLRRIVITLFICLTSAGWVDLPYPSRKCWQKSSPSVSVLVERISIPFFHLPFVFDGRQTCKNHLLPKNSFTDFFSTKIVGKQFFMYNNYSIMLEYQINFSFWNVIKNVWICFMFHKYVKHFFNHASLE
jgi:hypothetical protein